MKFKRIIAVSLCVCLLLAGTMTSMAAEEGWNQDERGWWYQNQDGTYPLQTWWQDADESWYYFDQDGYILTDGYKNINGVIYPFEKSGVWTGYQFADLTPGSWNGLTYTNPWTGLTLTVPEGTGVHNAAELDWMDNPDYIEFEAIFPDGMGSNVALSYIDTGRIAEGGAVSIEQCTTLMALSLNYRGMTVTSADPVKLGGKDYIRINSNLAGTIHSDVIYRIVGHYLECITLSYMIGSKGIADSVVNGIR